MIRKSNNKDQLFKAILSLESIEECYQFFDDLCTIKEVEAMAQRFESAILLYNNKTFEQVIAKTKISSTTLSRVSKCFHHGSGGYHKIICRIEKNID